MRAAARKIRGGRPAASLGFYGALSGTVPAEGVAKNA